MKKLKNILLQSTLLLLTTSSIGCLAIAQSFEGKITIRDIALNTTVLESALMNEVEENYDESWDELSDEELLKMQSKKLFEFSIDKLKSLVQSSEEYNYSEESLYSEYKSEIWIKGNKFSITGADDEGNFVQIFELGNPIIYMLKPSDKVVVQIDLDQYSPKMRELLGTYKNTDENKFFMSSTDKTRKINGFDATLYEGTNESGDLQQLWITKEIDGSLFLSFMKIMENVNKIAGIEVNEKEIAFFKKVQGLSILDKELSNGNLNISEVVSIKKITVPEGKFTIPSDYKKMSWEQMFGIE